MQEIDEMPNQNDKNEIQELKELLKKTIEKIYVRDKVNRIIEPAQDEK